MKYKEHNIDYWFPGHFSIYENDSKLYQFISAKRLQTHASWIKSQFVWCCLSENVSIEFFSTQRKAASVLVSTNDINSKQDKERLLSEMKTAHNWFPPETSFFVIGNPKLLGLPIERKVYSINTTWLVRARKGSDLKGKLQLTKNNKLLPIDERLVNNLQEALKTCT